jgi:hypothetical protein
VEDDLLQGDDYLARVTPIVAGDTTAYHITFDIDPGCRLYDDLYDQNGQNNALPDEDDPPLEVIPPDTPTDLRVCPNNPDYWPVALFRRDALSATITYDYDQGDIQMRLLRPNGSVRLASVGTGDSEVIEYQAEEDGIYYLRVYGEGEDFGPYTLDYQVEAYCLEDDEEENDDVGSPSAFDDVGTLTDLWRCAGDDDFYAYTLPGDSTATGVTVTLTRADESGDSLSLEVTSPRDGADPVAGTGTADERSVTLDGADLIPGGTYLVRVFGPLVAQGSYDLSVALEE